MTFHFSAENGPITSRNFNEFFECMQHEKIVPKWLELTAKWNEILKMILKRFWEFFK